MHDAVMHPAPAWTVPRAVVMALLWAVGGAMAQPNTPPPQNPSTPSPWSAPAPVRSPAPPVQGAAPGPWTGAPATVTVVPSAATVTPGLPIAAARWPYGLRGQLTLSEFLSITLGQVAQRAYVLMPNTATPTFPITADLDRFPAADPLPLVRQVLATLGLGMTEASGVLVIHQQTGRDLSQQGQDLWVYTPRHRTVASLAAYLGLFPKLSFAYTTAAGLQTGSWATMDTLGQTLPSMSPGTWPGAGGAAGSWGAGAAGGAGWAGAEGVAGAMPGQVGAYGWPGAGGGWAYGGGAAYGGAPISQGPYNTATFHDPTAASDPPALLVVRGQPQDIDVFRRFLDQVDLPVPEVLLQAYVLEVRDAESRDSAVQLVVNLLGGRVSGLMGAAPAESSLLRLSGREGGLSIGRLTSDSRVRLVSSPTLRASDGSVASVTIGTDTPTLGSIVTFSGASQQSVTYQSAGVLLNISPRILGESIRLMIWQEVSSFIRTETGLSATPTKLRRAFRSDVVARSGETILLGGLSESSQSQVDETTFLGLGSRSRVRTNSEVVVLLQVRRLDGEPVN